ncbi:MAG TPA: RNA polymerase sigma factor [Bacteroidetes bacterium]|nr:RNA polymerase sigma factor [Bacteroidota bacterium]
MTEVHIKTILAGCRRKDRASQQALYKLYYSYGMAVCFRYVESEQEAISVLNEGFLKVFLNIKKFDDSMPFKPWFRKILVNTAINHIKKQKKFKLEVSMEAAKDIPGREDILSRISYRELMETIQSLSTAYRTVFNMYVIDGFKHEEIAQKLGITVSTSKSNLTRARARLQELVRQKLKTKYA